MTEKKNQKDRARSREIFGFMMFDFANSSYTTVIITAVFNAYFVRAVVNEANRGELLWSITLSISYLLVLFFGPVFGALADYSGLKKRFLFFSYILCVLFTGLLFFVRPGYTLVAMVFVIFSNLGFSASEIFVSSFLPDIAGQENMGRISGYAWSFGYVGGLLSLAICLIILNFYHPESDAVSYLPIRLTNLVTAVFFAVAAIPTFLWVRERKEKKKIPEQENIFSLSFKRLAVTFQNIAQFKELIRFLVSFIFFHSGIAIVIAFAAIYAQKELGFTPALTVLLVIVVNVTASAGAFIFGFIQDKAGAKKGIFITLVIWIVTVVAAFFIRSRELFWIVANLAGIAMGASLTSARALVGMFSPQSKSAEFFGFWGFAQKFSAILGILTFGLMSYLFSSNRLAILLTIFYFAAGFIVLLFVNEEKGRQAAVNYVDKT